MMENVIIGQYIPKDSFIHKLDPRAKLIIVFLFVFVVFLANNTITYGILGTFTLFSILLSRIPLIYIYKGLKPIIIIMLFTVILHLLMTKEGPILYQWGIITIHEEGVKQGIFIALRLLFLIMFTSLLTLTTTPIDITDGLENLLGPLKKVKLPVHEFALMMSISLRFIPTLMKETEKIMKAQTARGAEFSSGPLKDRIKAFIPLLVPLFVSAFKRAEDLALAMESRGYRGGEGRTKLRALNWELRDTYSILMIIIFTILLLVLRSY
jgi:energy-coupling factor transport system permease protein